MANIIQAKDFLLQLKHNNALPSKIMLSDLLEIPELGMTVPFSRVLNTLQFYDLLKKATSDFNSDAALSGYEFVDFDDLYTRYSEYVEAFKTCSERDTLFL